MEDEYGYDPDKSYTKEDNPFWDGTDGAHPAWWRGNDAGVISCCQVLKKIADTGEHRGTFGFKPLEDMAQLILEYQREIHFLKTGKELGEYA